MIDCVLAANRNPNSWFRTLAHFRSVGEDLSQGTLFCFDLQPTISLNCFTKPHIIWGQSCISLTRWYAGQSSQRTWLEEQAYKQNAQDMPIVSHGSHTQEVIVHHSDPDTIRGPRPGKPAKHMLQNSSWHQAPPPSGSTSRADVRTDHDMVSDEYIRRWLVFAKYDHWRFWRSSKLNRIVCRFFWRVFRFNVPL